MLAPTRGTRLRLRPLPLIAIRATQAAVLVIMAAAGPDRQATVIVEVTRGHPVVTKARQVTVVTRTRQVMVVTKALTVNLEHARIADLQGDRQAMTTPTVVIVIVAPTRRLTQMAGATTSPRVTETLEEQTYSSAKGTALS